MEDFDPGIVDEPEAKPTTKRTYSKSATPRTPKKSQHDMIHETLAMMQQMGLDTELKFLHLTRSEITFDQEKQVYVLLPPNRGPNLTFTSSELHVIAAAFEDLLKTPAGEWIVKNVGGRGFSINMFMAFLIVSKHGMELSSLRSEIIRYERVKDTITVEAKTKPSNHFADEVVE